MSNSLAVRWMKDFKKSSLDVGFALNSLMSRDKSDEYCLRGPEPTGSKYPKLDTRLGSETKPPGGTDPLRSFAPVFEFPFSWVPSPVPETIAAPGDP